ncbi:unnamed protein product [Zymoseptoria tritici ST99CH_3D1]|nr:unnamed protein product [Zymoseptoria tritici ST99CH_3D1]
MVNISDTTGTDWETMAKMYKKLTMGVSSKPITAMLNMANAYLPFSEASGIHDNGCGPGNVIERIVSDYGGVIPSTASLSASDFAPAMVEKARGLKTEALEKDPSSPWGRVDVKVGDAMNLQGVKDGSLSHITAGWVYFLTPDPMKCLKESKRVLKDGGVLSCSSWQSSQWMDTMKIPAKVRPDLQHPSVPTEWASAPALKAELEKAGFRDVQAQEVEVTMEFDTYDALLELCFEVMPHMAAVMKGISEEERTKVLSLAREMVESYSPTEPGKLTGIALVAGGRK